jgi:hypothetical protein
MALPSTSHKRRQHEKDFPGTLPTAAKNLQTTVLFTENKFLFRQNK